MQSKLIYLARDDAENSINRKLQNPITFRYSIYWQHRAPIVEVQKAKNFSWKTIDGLNLCKPARKVATTTCVCNPVLRI